MSCILHISEIFHSIQGEGCDQGLPTVFIRLAGCNLQCSWCDTKYAWGEGEEKDKSEVLEKVESFFCKRVCVTGGEPLEDPNAIDLMETLVSEGYEVCLETNGSKDITPVPKQVKICMDMKTPSSGMHFYMKRNNIEHLREHDELKFVIADEKDYEFAKDVLKDHQPQCHVIFQPKGGMDGAWIVEKIKMDKLHDVRVLAQLHKVFWGEKKGV